MKSTWIDSIRYKRTPTGESYLAMFLRERKEGCTLPQRNVALLYGPNIPSWIPGLILAGTARRSPGRAYNKLLKGKYPYQRIEGRENVKELKEMMQ